MTWINLPSVSVQSGSKTVTVSNVQTTHIKVGDALLIGNYQPVEISGVFATQLTLRENWSNAAQTNVVAVVMPTSGDFVTATKVLKEATETTRSNFAALEKWATQMGTVEFKGQDNTPHTGRTFKQMDADVADLEAQASNLIINVSGRGFARSEADMLATIATSNTQYAASGMIHAGKYYNALGPNGLPIYEGMWSRSNADSPNKLFLGFSTTSAAGSSETNYPVFNIAGFPISLRGLNTYDLDRTFLKFPEAPDGTVTYDSATGAVVKHPDAATAFASETSTTKVVTERVDMFGLEMNLQTINDAQPFFAPYGCAQSQSTAVDGIATEVDNINPISYFAAYPGDTTSRGRGWNITKLSDAQKEKLFANPEHNVFRMNNGELKYAKVVQKTIPGAGNGDWENVNPATGNPLRFDANTPVLSPAGQPYVPSKQWRGIFEDGTGYYFYVLGTVLRLNQGAYHPSFNQLGTGQFSRDLNNSGKVDQGVLWNNSFLRQELSPKTKADCFGPILKYNSDIAGPSRYSHYIDGFYLSGSIASARSGHPDGKFYDAIYPEGEGGVIDRRLSAFPITMEDYFKAMAKAENGSMRGMESLSETAVFDCGVPLSKGQQPTFVHINLPKGTVPSEFFNAYTTDGGSTFVGGHFIDASGAIFTIAKVWGDSGNDYVYLTRAFGLSTTSLDITGKCFVVPKRPINISVSGNFLQTDVIAHPENILQVDALKDGWVGSWIPETGSGTKTLTRKSLSSAQLVWSIDLGASWSLSSPWAVDSVTNKSVSGVNAASTVGIVTYTAAAKVTKPSSASKVYGYKKGLGSVITTQDYRAEKGSLLAESLMGKVLTSSASGKRYGSCPLTSDLVGHDGLLYNVVGYLPEHHPITMSQPDNSSPAIKILPHAASENGQATLAFAWNEIKHDGTSWNDDGQIRVIGGIGTYNNLKPESCLYGYADLALPIGWVDNHARFGAQVPGVDL